MTLEERLVQHIKDTGLGVLINDEDAITELTRRAVHEALIQPRRVPRQFGGYEEKTSPLVDAARDIAQETVKRIMEAEIKRLMEDPETMKLVRSALAEAFPHAIQTAAQSFYQSVSQHAYIQATNKVMEHINGNR
jgi:hypothetical protein